MIITAPLRLAVRIVVLVGALAVLYVAVTFVQVWWTARQDRAAPADAIVVLGAAQWDGRPSPVLQSRLDHAARLYDDGIAPRIIVTGGMQAGDRVTQGFASYDYLRGEGIPEAALLVEVDGTDTYTELSASANILRVAGAGERVVLVSDPYHALRASMIAAEVGLDARFSPSSPDASMRQLARETAAVAIGRIVGFRRLSNWT